MDEDRFEEPETDERKSVLGIALGIVAVVAIGAAILYFAVLKKPKAAPAETAPAVEKVEVPAATNPAAGALAEGEAMKLPAVGLDESDPVVREYGAGLSTGALFPQWLQSKDLVRKFVVIVDNIAEGQSPRTHVDFFAPQGKFKVTNTKQGTFIDEASYARYDKAAEVVTSLDPNLAARFYRGLKPLIQDAYKELGYPDANFDDTLVRAMRELLAVPVVEGRVQVEKNILSFEMTDKKLEEMSAAQKHLFRMGPKSVAAVQAKIREFAAALGVPESKLAGLGVK